MTMRIDIGEQRDDSTCEPCIRPSGSVDGHAGSDGNHRDLRFRNLGMHPHRFESVDTKQCRARHESRSLAHTQFREDSVDGRNESRAGIGPTLRLQLTNRAFRYAEDAEPLARGSANRLASSGLSIEQRQIFLLRFQPGRCHDLRQRLTPAHTRQRCFDAQARDVPLDASLHDLQPGFVECDAAYRRQLWSQCGFLDSAETDAQVLADDGTDLDCCPATLVCVDRNEIHVHEGRLAGLVESCVRHHGVVPIENLARAWFGFRLLLRYPVSGGRAQDEHGDRCTEQLHVQLLHGDDPL
jgi:hypothetical protein